MTPQMTDSPKRILIVDDDPALVDVLTSFFQRNQDRYVVEATSGGEDAFLAFLQQRPDLVLLDITLPGMSGLELLKQLRELAPRVPVIMVTGTHDHRALGDAMANGAFGCVPKPFDLRYIEHMVAAALQPTNR